MCCVERICIARKEFVLCRRDMCSVKRKCIVWEGGALHGDSIPFAEYILSLHSTPSLHTIRILSTRKTYFPTVHMTLMMMMMMMVVVMVMMVMVMLMVVMMMMMRRRRW